MALFDSASMAAIDAVAAKSKQRIATKPAISNSTVDKISSMEETVREYFKDSEAILITSKEQLHEYIDGCIDAGYVGIDTETTGLDKVLDTIVGSSLYYPGGVECYIPNFHKVPIMENYRSNQLSYAECQEEFQRLVDNKVKCIFANADFDIAMLYKDYKVDFIPVCYYDVILAWRVIKENEPHNGLKQLYTKYVLKGAGDPKKFSDFFDAKTFPYCKPDVAKLYAAHDAKITYELFLWQLPYVTKTNPKCISHHLEHIADIVWGIEIPMIKACAELHRTGMYIEKDVASYITKRYNEYYEKELATMRDMVQKLIDEMDIPNNSARPFKTGADFNPDSVVHTKYLLYTLMQVPVPTVGKNKGKKPTGKEVVGEINMPEAKQLLKVRSLSTLIGTFTEKLPNSVASDNRIHASFKSIGAATGRMSSQSPNLQNIPSRHTDIRHMFRATPEMETDGECTIEGTMLRIELNLLSVVYLDSGEEKQVKNLVCGDLVEIRLGNKTNAPIRYFPVKSKVINEPNAYVYIGADDVSSDIHYVLRHRTPPYALIGSDYSQQEPKILGFVAKDPEMIKAFSDGKDIYSTIASIAFNVPYEECLENHPVTGEYQKEGKARRTQAKSIVLGISYGRSIPSIAEQLFGSDDTMSDDEKTKEAQKVYDSVMAAFPNLRQLMISAQATATQKGYVETILGRRRHIPDMMLPPFAFEPMAGYVNPDIDPLDPSTLHNKEVIPTRIVDALTKEYSSFKYNGQRYRRNKELYEEHIKVIDNRSKINDASRECVNCVDFETEILTQDGWKSYKEVSVGDKILSYSLDKQQIVKDAVEAVHTYYGPHDVVRFESSTFSAVSTMNHRWVVGDGQTVLHTKGLILAEGVGSSILRIAKNNFESACLLSDDELKLTQLPITFDFVSLLSCHQANVLLNHLSGSNSFILCEDIKTADVVQYLCAVAGYASSVSEQRIGVNTRYVVTVDYSDCVDLSGCDVSYETASGVWCVTTHESTWIARRNGTVYITGNSIIQGSASELTKMAIISLINNKDWQRFGGRFLVPVHDELIAEVPAEYAEEAGKVLTDCMVNAGSFLPFAINCDLEITYRWYGLSVNSIAYKHQKPESLDNMSEDNIKWVQAHICEMEYVLPLFNDENGEKPRGDAAHGVNGIWTQELSDSIDDYCVRFNIPKSDFISDIQQRVECGYVKPKLSSNHNKN